MSRFAAFLILAVGIATAGVRVSSVHAASEVFSPLKTDEVKGRVLVWLKDRNAPDTVQKQIEAIWSTVDATASADRLLELLIQSLAVSDADVMKLVRECNAPPNGIVVARPLILSKLADSPFFQANLQLFYGRYLVERRLFDEAWEILKSVDSQLVVDPASLFFFQAVAAQGMLEIKPALHAIDQLLSNTERVPVRYSATATLMQVDLKALKEKSLAEIARLMADSERRLELGRAGETIQGVQERIISDLDEIIKKIEQQQGSGAGSGKSGGEEGGNNNNSANPADDSRVKGTPAPGDVDKKRFDHKGSWGNLNEKEQAKAKNDLNKNFPSHYEQAIEKYTRKLATRQAKKK